MAFETLPEPAALARAVSAVAGGSLIAWAVFREGTAETWVRKDLEALLAPYRARREHTPRQTRVAPRGRKSAGRRR